MQFKVPQDVQQADRIVSFLTLTQLIICIIGFAISYGVYAALNNQGLPIVFWLPPVLIIGALTLAFAFLKIANLPFHYYLALLIERFMTPSKRIWVKGGDRVIDQETYVSPEDKKGEEKAKKLNELQQQKEEKLLNISEITDVLDTLKNEPPTEEILEEIDQTEDKELLQKAFLDQSTPKAESVEEKIKAVSQAPTAAPAQEIKPAMTAVAPPTIEGTPEKKKKRRRRRRKKKSGSQLVPAATAPASNAAPMTIKESPAKPVEPKREVPRPEPVAPQKEPEVPSWLEEKPAPEETPAIKPVETVKASPEPIVAPVPEAAPVEITKPEPEELLEAPEPEELLEAPEPELDLPAPEVELELTAPKEEKTPNTTPQTSEKTIKISESFSPDELKQGQVIKIPKTK